MGTRCKLFVALLLVIVGLAGCATGTSNTACNLYAAPTGQDSNSGAVDSPLASVNALDAKLTSGQVGCLRTGHYGGAGTRNVLSHSGVTITSAPGELAVVSGRIEVSGSDTHLSYLNLDVDNTVEIGHETTHPGCVASSNGLVVDATGFILEHSDVSEQSGTAPKNNLIGLGWVRSADGFIIRYNKLHDAGGCLDYDHLIYDGHSTGGQIYGNWMWGDHHGWAVQLYPGAHDTKMWANVIDDTGSGVTIAGESSSPTSGSQVYGNVIINQTGLQQAGLALGVGISTYWGGTPGAGNSFTGNYVNTPGGVGNPKSIVSSGNVVGDPKLTNPLAHDYTLLTGSPVASWGLWDGH